MTEAQPPLLLHSLATFEAELIACLDAARPRRIVEIGSETGAFSDVLLDWATGNDATVVTVDPEPPEALRSRAGSSGNLEVVAGASPAALEEVEPAGAYVIDGDHNYFTVGAELEGIYAGREEDPSSAPLTILHDVCWPCGRRDAYYAPDRIPAEHRHPHDYRRGAVPGRSELVEGGFRGGGEWAFATNEGGPANGVLTAVEDFLADRPALRLVVLPCVFGVGVLFHRGAPYATTIEERLGSLDESALLARLEENRLHLYLTVLDLQDELERRRARFDSALASAHARIGVLEAQNSALRLDGVRP